MNLSLPLFHFETWATLLFSLVSTGFLLFAYLRTRMLPLLSLVIGDILFIVQLFIHYGYWLGHLLPTPAVQLSMTALFLVASLFTTIGMALLCLRLATPTI